LGLRIAVAESSFFASLEGSFAMIQVAERVVCRKYRRVCWVEVSSWVEVSKNLECGRKER